MKNKIDYTDTGGCKELSWEEYAVLYKYLCTKVGRYEKNRRYFIDICKNILFIK